MIEWIYSDTSPNFRHFPSDSPIVGRICAYYRAYGAGHDFCKFYIGGHCLIMRYESELLIYADENADFDELLFFVQTQGNCVITASEELSGIFQKQRGYTAEKLYKMSRRADCNHSYVTAELSEDYSAVGEVIKDSFGLYGEAYDSWYADICHRVRHGVSKIAVIKKEGKIVAACVIMYQNGGESFLSDICVKSGYRRQGLGRGILCAAENLCDADRLSLVCGEENIGFYRRCGFEIAGTLYRAEKYTKKRDRRTDEFF